MKLYQYTDNVFHNMIAKTIVKYLGDNCLEIGCGAGGVANKVAEHIDTVIGIDKSFNMIKKARINNKAEFIVADLLSLPFQDFDIVSINTLDLFEPRLFIRSIKKCIKNTLILVDPYDFRDSTGDPIDSYDGRVIRRILVEEGFEIDDKTREEQYIPWRVRINDRAYMLYLADLIIDKLIYFKN